MLVENLQPEVFIIVIHLVVAILVSVYVFFGKSHLRKEHIIIILVVPIVGLIYALTVQLLNTMGKQGDKNVDMLPLAFDDILWKSLKSTTEDGNLVPLEEAMLIDDFGTRRRIMLDALYDDPMKYLDVLLIARHNDDIDTTHYATTMISHAQKQFQLSLQKFAAAIENEPENSLLLDKYIDTLEKYIQSDLLDEHLLRNQRIAYAKLLDRKLANQPEDQQTLIKKLRNLIELNDYFSAFEVSQFLKQKWPDDERIWIEALRVCVEGKDQKKLEETITEINSANITWTRQGKQEVTPWLGEEAV